MLETVQKRRDGGGAPVRSPVRHVFHFVSSCWANETSYGSYVSLSLVREKCGIDSYSATVGLLRVGKEDNTPFSESGIT